MILDPNQRVKILVETEGGEAEYVLEHPEYHWEGDWNSQMLGVKGLLVDGEERVKAEHSPTVADLGIADLHKTRVRIEKGDGVYEGVVHAIRTAYDTHSSWSGTPYGYRDDVELRLGSVSLEVKPSTPITIIKENA